VVFLYTIQHLTILFMKKHIVFILAFVTFSSSCKKDTTTAPIVVNPNIKNTPNLIAMGFKPGEAFSQTIWHIYDLNHDKNEDKKFIRIQMYSDDSARIIEGPTSIDNLSGGWPADVKEVKWSPGSQFIINSQFYLQMQGGGFQRVDYDQVNPQQTWLKKHNSIPGIIVLPNNEVNVTGGSGEQDLQLIYFQLNGATLNTVSGYRVFNFASAFGQAFNAYANWEDVSHVIFIRTGGVSAWPTFYFFDFKNWRYWKIDKSQGLLGDWIGHPVKSLDRFLKWPEGWGKK
jgi:hypothetical protein